MRKLNFLLLLSLVLILFMTACSKDEEVLGPDDVEIDEEQLVNLNETGMPIVKEPITLNFMAGKSALSSNNYDEVLLWQEYEKMTNIKINK